MKKVIKIILLLMCLAGVVGIGISVANSFEKDNATQGHIHKYEDVVVEATCTTDGYSVKECACGKSLGEKTVIKATGHSWGNWITDKAATCTESGSKHKECANCDKRIDEVIAATGHNYANTITAPTCTDKGYTTHTCVACGYTNVDSYVNKKGHSYADTKTEPTCTEQGYTTHTCKVCEDTYADNYVAPTGHTYGDWYVTTAPTCTSTGVERRDCENCSHYETRETAKAEHNFGDWYAVTTPTCSSSVERRDCKDCGHSETRDGELAAHTFGDWYVTTTPTCTLGGEERRDCKNCDYYETRSVAATGHTYVDVVTAPTCTAQGYTTHACETCEDSYVDTYVAATGHSYSNWITDKAATCTTAGSKHKECASCGDISSEAIEPTGHTYVDVVTAPTCTAQGYTTHTCKTCEYSYVDSYITETGHSWSDWIIDEEATCTESGSKHKECANCDETIDEVITATGHNYVNCVCENCGNVIYSEGLEYSLTSYNKTSCYAVTGIGTCEDTYINIPSTYNGLPVMIIEDSAFYNCTSITGVNLPDSVKKIVTMAFYGCTNLESINIPDSVTVLESYVFYNCTSLINIELPGLISVIQDSTFFGCTSLESITFTDAVTTIESDAFKNCTSLTDVHYDGGLKDWNNISIDSGNTCLTNAKIHGPYSYYDINISFADATYKLPGGGQTTTAAVGSVSVASSVPEYVVGGETYEIEISSCQYLSGSTVSYIALRINTCTNCQATLSAASSSGRYILTITNITGPVEILIDNISTLI